MGTCERCNKTAELHWNFGGKPPAPLCWRCDEMHLDSQDLLAEKRDACGEFDGTVEAEETS
jgi:hypothetical protein